MGRRPTMKISLNVQVSESGALTPVKNLKSLAAARKTSRRLFSEMEMQVKKAKRDIRAREGDRKIK